jgi:hypothetical protein
LRASSSICDGCLGMGENHSHAAQLEQTRRKLRLGRNPKAGLSLSQEPADESAASGFIAPGEPLRLSSL